MMSSLLIKESPEIAINPVVHQVQNYEIMANQFSTATQLLKHLKLLARLNSVDKVTLNLIGVSTEFLSEYYNAVENISMHVRRTRRAHVVRAILLKAQEPTSDDSMMVDSDNSDVDYNSELWAFLQTKIHEIKHEEQYRWLGKLETSVTDVISLTRVFDNVDQMLDQILSLYLFISIKIFHKDYSVITEENAINCSTAFKTILDQSQNEEFRTYLKEVFWSAYFDELINSGSELLIVVQREG